MLLLRHKDDNLIECGIDEAGRGSLWGPLYAAAVIWSPESEWNDEVKNLSELIKDSKKISKKKRNIIYHGIIKQAVSYGIGIVTAEEIDEMGMTKANKTAFHRAFCNLSNFNMWSVLAETTLPSAAVLALSARINSVALDFPAPVAGVLGGGRLPATVTVPETAVGKHRHP